MCFYKKRKNQLDEKFEKTSKKKVWSIERELTPAKDLLIIVKVFKSYTIN